MIKKKFVLYEEFFFGHLIYIDKSDFFKKFFYLTLINLEVELLIPNPQIKILPYQGVLD